MDRKTIQTELAGYFPSGTLRAQLQASEFTLPSRELLYAIYQYSPTFQERMRLLSQLAEACPEVADHAHLVMEWQNRILEQFQKPESGTVFEVQIAETPDSIETRWVCDSWDAAVKMLNLYFREYPPEPGENPRRVIVKRQIISQPVSLRFDEEIGICYFGPENVLTDIRLWNSIKEFDCDGNCIGCESAPCVEENFPQFPWQPKTGTPVRCDTPRGHMGWTGYGVVWSNTETDSECFIIPLHSVWEVPKDSSELFYDHHHVPRPYVQELTPQELPESLQPHWKWLSEQLR